MIDKTPLPTVHPINGNTILLSDLGHKVAHGGELSNRERTMAISAATSLERNKFGPGPGEMELGRIPLPENVSGAIADAMG